MTDAAALNKEAAVWTAASVFLSAQTSFTFSPDGVLRSGSSYGRRASTGMDGRAAAKVRL